jgi:PAS domain S-box-containing protein/diguanylate cyclase (GGDEF)-like protein
MATAAVHRLAAIVRAAHDAIFEVGPDGRISLWNPAAEQIFGYAEAEAVGMTLTTLVPADRRAEAEWTLAAASDGEAPAPYETIRLHRDGTAIPVSLVVSPVRGDDGHAVSAAVIARDLRPLNDSRAQLALREARYRALVERAGDLYTICTADGILTYVSPRIRTHGGRKPADLVGMSVFDLIPTEDRSFGRAALASIAATPGPHEPVLIRGTDAAGNTRWFRVLATNLIDDPAVRGIVVVVQDVTEQKAAEDELALSARIDQATGLPTRAALPEAVAALRAAGCRDVAVAVVEVDGLRDVRHEAGHLATEVARRAVAERLRTAAAEDDTVVRLGGDEFAVLRGGVSGDAAAQRFGDDLLAAVGEPVDVHAREWTLAATVGVAASPDDEADALVRAADVARYEVKARGLARAAVYTPDLERAHADRIELIALLRPGLAYEALRVEYQPAVRLADGAVVGAEALVRWQAPDGRLLGPAEFLPAAAASGLLPETGRWVLRQACAAAAAWAGDPAPYVAVNVTARELAEEVYAATVAGVLADVGLAPGRLVLEVADTPSLAQDADVVGALEELAGLGVRVAIDGFGTGSLVYLKRLPVSVVKIGRELIAGLGRDEDDDAIVASLLNLAAAIGVHVVAVGVETEEQRAQLAQLGCEVAQGYLLGRPAPEPCWAVVPPAGTSRARRKRRTAPALDPLVVARIRSLMREGASLYTIAAALNAEQLAHPQERRWHPRAVAHVMATAPELTGPRERWGVL